MDPAAVSPTVIVRSRRELEPYSDLILKLCQPGMKFEDLRAELADRGIHARYALCDSYRSLWTYFLAVKKSYVVFVRG